MGQASRIVYQSSKGDRWLLATWPDNSQFRVIHIANARSGGHIATYDVETFLTRDRDAPQGQALLELLGLPVTDSTEATFEERLARAVPA